MGSGQDAVAVPGSLLFTSPVLPEMRALFVLWGPPDPGAQIWSNYNPERVAQAQWWHEQGLL